MPKPKLFLADDNPLDGMLLNMGFAEAGRAVEIVQARDGAHATCLLQEAVLEVPFPFGLIVIDLNMPKVDGLELLTRLRGWPQLTGVPIVILTSSTSPADRQRSLLCNPTAFLIKADDFGGLASVVGKLVPYLFPENPAEPQAA